MIEFVNDEPFCRYNGILCDQAGCVKIYGYPEDLNTIDDTTIIHGNTLYTDHDLFTVIKLISKYQGKTEEYDKLLNKGGGFIDYCERIKYDNSYIIDELQAEDFKGIKKIKPFSFFKEDYSEISLEEYFKFQDALDEYYNNLQIGM